MTTAARSTAATYEPPRSFTGADAPTRVASIDVVRGVAMILMAIDHVRVYSGVPAGGPNPGVFFTRWVTHFVAPAFVLLAGTGAFLHGRRLGNRAALARFLVTRGLWLVFLELTVVRLAWTFNVDYAQYALAGVLWMLGWCMVLLAPAVFLPTRAVGALGVGIVALHNLADVAGVPPGFGDGHLGALAAILYVGGAVPGTPLLVLFALVPWIGVMMAGYALGAVMELPAERRRRICLRLGIGLTAGFLVLRALEGYGDPRPWHGSQLPAPLAFLAATKYPASLDFLLMTLGPTLVLLGLVEGVRGRVTHVAETFGRVPLFYYLLHVPVIHLAACLVSIAREGQVNPWLFGNHPFAPPEVPAGYTWSLPLLYVVFVACVAFLYRPCRWFARVRAERKSPWLSYL